MEEVIKTLISVIAGGLMVLLTQWALQSRSAQLRRSEKYIEVKREKLEKAQYLLVELAFLMGEWSRGLKESPLKTVNDVSEKFLRTQTEVIYLIDVYSDEYRQEADDLHRLWPLMKNGIDGVLTEFNSETAPNEDLSEEEIESFALKIDESLGEAAKVVRGLRSKLRAELRTTLAPNI